MQKQQDKYLDDANCTERYVLVTGKEVKSESKDSCNWIIDTAATKPFLIIGSCLSHFMKCMMLKVFNPE